MITSNDKATINHPISILHIMQGTHMHGGTPRELLSLLVNGNHDKVQHIFLLFANSNENLNQEYRKAGAIVEEVNRRRNWDIRLLWDILKIRKKYHCDIINTHFARADIYGAIAGVLARVPIIKSVHGILWNKSLLLQKIDGLLSQLRVCTICNSEATRRAVISQTGAQNTKVVYIGVPFHAMHLTVEQIITKRTELNIPPDAFVIIHVGGMIELREQSVIIHAVRNCINKKINAYLVFVGDGPLRQQLETKSCELGLSQRIRFLGYRSDVSELNAMADVFVNMARDEGFGIAVVEAMHAGLPVVLANAGALPELIDGGKTGLLVHVSNDKELADTLIMLSNDKELKRQLGEKGKKQAINRFSLNRYVNDIEDIYLSVVNDHHFN